MYGSVHASATQQGLVVGIDDGIQGEDRDSAIDYFHHLDSLPENTARKAMRIDIIFGLPIRGYPWYERGMETVRAFIAVDIGKEIRARLDELQRRLKKVHADVRWVNPRNMHLTLVFLGNLPIEKVGAVKDVVEKACRDRHAFALAAQGTGFFGKPKHPRVVWAGLADCPPLLDLQGGIAQGLHTAGIPFDSKPFAPHLTLGRFREPDRHTGPLLERIEKYREAGLGTALIDHVEFIQSVLTPRGAEYTELHRAALA